MINQPKMSATDAAVISKIKKRNKNKKRTSKPTSTETPSAAVTTTTTTTNPTSTDSKKDQQKKLRDKLNQLKTRRIGVTRLKEAQSYKEAHGTKPKNVMRNMARDGIHELLAKLGIQDSKVENEIMNEIVRGNLRTPDQIASFVVQKLQQKFPDGPQTPSSLTKRNVAVPPPPVTSVGSGSGSGSSSSSGTGGVRKPLRHPTQDLLVGGMQPPPTTATTSTPDNSNTTTDATPTTATTTTSNTNTTTDATPTPTTTTTTPDDSNTK
jgi:hypothetical protein